MMFKDYKVLITGATSGIGLETTRKFLAEGATVIGLGRNFDKTKDLGDKFIPCKCDVTKPEDLAAAVAFARKQFDGKLDTFVSVAGAGLYGRVTDITCETYAETFDVILRPAMVFTAQFADMLAKAESGNASILFVSSLASHLVSTNNVLYCTSKNALVYYTMQVAASLPGVRCNCVCPGYIDTPIFTRDGALDDTSKLQVFEQMAAITPVGRIGRTTDISETIAFLCSDQALYITGANVFVDGGITTKTSA